MLKINENYRVIADSYSYALQEKKVSQKGEETWNPVGYYPTVTGPLKKLREINRKNLLSAAEVLLITDLITSLEAMDEAFMTEIKAIEAQIVQEALIKPSKLIEAIPEEIASEPKTKKKKQKDEPTEEEMIEALESEPKPEE